MLIFLIGYENQLLSDANKLQLKAAKTDVLFRMLDSFNRDSIQVTVTWTLVNHISRTINRFMIILVRSSKQFTLPSLYTIVKYYPTILFTLQNNSNYQEDTNDSQICNDLCIVWYVAITFMNTDAVKDTKSLCTCIALLDNSFRRFADVTVKENWTDCDSHMSFKTIGNTDQ